jgi:hypothetical protein
MLYRAIWLLLDSTHRLVCGSFTKDHNVSETWSVSVLRWMGQDRPTQLGPSERAGLQWLRLAVHILSQSVLMQYGHTRGYVSLSRISSSRDTERERERRLQMVMTFVEGGGVSGCRRKGLLYDTHTHTQTTQGFTFAWRLQYCDLSCRMNSDGIRPGFDSRQAQDFSVFYSIEPGSGAHKVSYPVGTGDDFPPGVKR